VEIRKAEELSVARGTHNFFDLMLIAGGAVAQAAHGCFPQGRILVLCGTGNNGGDGYVAAQSLLQAGRDVRVAALGAPATGDAQKAAALWRGETLPATPALLDQADLVIDALFGTGLTRPIKGLAAQLVEAVASRALPVVAADLPSGICGDTGRVLGCAMKAAVTVTFFRKKRGHVLLPARDYVGAVLVADTGMHADVLDEVKPLIAENENILWRADIPRPSTQAHKYDRGHAVVYGGALMTGASRLAARAAQRMGAGLVSLLAPQAAWEVYARALESVIVMPEDKRDELLADPKRNALLIGPGLGLEEGRRADVLAALATRKPCVLDADALTLFAQEPDALFQALHQDCILTPHEGEFNRLFGARIDPLADKITRTQNAAKCAGCIVLLKGADTVIASPEGAAVVNSNAPVWLATGGSGDVLAGMILGLLANGVEPFAAACAGAHVHGACGMQAGAGLIAEDLVNAIPSFWAGFYGEAKP
jgi:NAD(P)H-hydrate epimerase